MKFAKWYVSLSGYPLCTSGYTYQRYYAKVRNLVRLVSFLKIGRPQAMNIHLDLVHLLRQGLAESMRDWMLSGLGQRSAMTKYMHA